MSSHIQPPGGILELPGMKGTIRIRYDLTKGVVELDGRGLAYAQLLQILLVTAQQAVNQWAMQEAGIIRPKGQESQEGKSTDGSQETGDQKNDDYDR